MPGAPNVTERRVGHTRVDRARRAEGSVGNGLVDGVS